MRPGPSAVLTFEHTVPGAERGPASEASGRLTTKRLRPSGTFALPGASSPPSNAASRESSRDFSFIHPHLVAKRSEELHEVWRAATRGLA